MEKIMNGLEAYEQLLQEKTNELKTKKELLATGNNGKPIADLFFEVVRLERECTTLLLGHSKPVPRFMDETHKVFFYSMMELGDIAFTDVERIALLYVLGISATTRAHIKELYDFDKNQILPDGLRSAYHTSGSIALVQYAFVLFNDFRQTDDEGNSTRPSILDIFCYVDSAWIPFLYDALSLRLGLLEMPRQIEKA